MIKHRPRPSHPHMTRPGYLAGLVVFFGAALALALGLILLLE